MKNTKKKLRAFTILELIFVIIIISVLSTIAIPKLLATKDDAVLSSIKYTVSLLMKSSIEYNAIMGKINNISEVVSLDDNKWSMTSNTQKQNNRSYIYKTDDIECIKFQILDDVVQILIADSKSNNVDMCSKIRKLYNLYTNKNDTRNGASINGSQISYIKYKEISLTSSMQL
jgi:general secretion pathway protein G